MTASDHAATTDKVRERLGLSPQIRTDEEFAAARIRWEKAVEQVLIEMSAVATHDGLYLHANPMLILNAFNEEVDSLQRARENHVIRCGMYVHAD